MKNLLLIFFIFWPPALKASGCIPLSAGRKTLLTLMSQRKACVAIVVARGEAVQLVAEQPIDVELETSVAGMPLASDSFDSGPELLTLEVAGSFEVNISSKVPISRAVVISISSRPLPVGTSRRWREAEVLGTSARKSADVAAFEFSARAWQAVGDQLAVARTLLFIGDSELERSNAKAAHTSYNRALEMCRAVGDLRCTAEAVNNAGLVAQTLGNYADSTAKLEQAAEAWRKLSQPANEGIAFSNLGLLFYRVGDYQRSINYSKRALALISDTEFVRRSRVWNNLGLCYQSMGEYQKSRGYLEKAAAGFQSGGARREKVLAKANIARTALLEGNFGLAEKLLREAVSEAEQLNDQANMGVAWSNLGQTLIEQGRFPEARTTLNSALALHRKLNNRRSEAIDLHWLGECARREGDLAAARSALSKAAAIRQECGLRESAADSLTALAHVEDMAGNRDGARRLAKQASDLFESVRSHVPVPALRASYLARKRALFDLLVDLESTPEAAFLAAERGRGRALLDTLTESSRVGIVSPDLLARRDAVQRGIDYAAQLLSTAKPDRVEELRRQVDMLVAEDQEIEAKVREKQADVKLAAPVHSLASIQQQLPPDTALLEYHLGGSRSQLWLITGNRLQAFPLPSRSVIEAECGPLIDAFANHVARRSSKGLQLAFEQRLRKVSQLLIGAIGNQPLPGVVIIVPDGILNRVPFAALEWKGDRLGLVRDLVQVPSASFLAAGKRPRPLADFRLSALAVADPVFGPPNQPWPLARLPFTSELDALAARIPAAKRVILRGPDASRQGLARQPLGDFALLHLSTHALIDDQVPELSRVALSMVDDKGKSVDGFLRPYQFAQWRLNGSTVALSACETALGKQVQGEGLLGLTASLFQAGAGHLILSLTPVDAESSSKFFSELYSNSFAPRPATVEHAATLARQTMAASKRWADPYDWATFVVYGRPSGAVGGTR